MARIVQQGIIQVAGSGETGVQVNEFEAAIKSVTSSTTVGAVFLYDCRNDSDGGAWRKKARGSWYYETLNTATRGGRRSFPSVALIVADNGGTSNVTIYDLDDPAMPMWMVINRGSGHILFGADMGSLYALNGRLYVGHNVTAGALSEISFADDFGFVRIHNTSAYNGATIADREVRTSDTVTGTTGALVSRAVNDVAATYLEGGELDSLGLVRPVVACATDGGVSVIHPNGSVYNITNSSGDAYEFTKKLSIDGNILAFVMDATGTPARDGWWFDLRTLYSDTTVNSGTNAGGIGSFSKTGESGDIIFVGDNVSALAKDAVGTEAGLSVYKRNDGNPEDSAVAYITSSYNTGYMLGDIKGAWLTGGDASTTGRYDRSVGNTDLVENGTILHAAAETDADVTKYYDFSASNYFSQANNTDFDFGDNDFSISLWAKNTNWTGDQRFLGRSQSASARRLSLYASTPGSTTSLVFYLADGGATHVTVADVLKTNTWQHIFACRKSSKLYLYVDGRLVGGPVNSTTNVTPTVASALVIGAETFNNLTSISNPFTNGSLSLVRLSATAPTPQQVKEIYEAEKPLFRAGAKCLLKVSSGETHGSPSAVNDLSYDDSTGLLWTSQNSNLTSNSVHAFRGLERVDTFDLSAIGLSGNTQHVAAQSGIVAPVREASSGGAGVSLPAVDVRGDINTADTKLPDDGKFHFSGVTASTSTPTVIGHIPIAIGEKVTVKARVQASVYNITSLNGYYEEVTMTFQRPYDTGTVAAHTVFSNPTHSLNDTTIASLDVELNANDTAKTCEVKVTGSSAYRMQWNAEVEVQRISEKQYER